MSDDTWNTIRQVMPWFFYHYERHGCPPAGGVHIQLRDHRTRHRIEFVLGHGHLAVTVDIPHATADARQLISVLDHQPAGLWHTTSLTHPAPAAPPCPRTGSDTTALREPPSERIATSTWHSSDSPDHHAALCDSIVVVMREGLSMNPANLRSSIWTRTGPRLQPSWGLFSLTESDRPTARDADSRCQDWDDFTHRLEWTLTTLPVGAVLILESPSDTGTPHLIQFKHERTLRGLAVLQRRHGDTTDHHDRMADLGWHHAPDLILSNTAQTWTDAGHCEQPNLPHHCAVRAATTLREIFHTAQPSQLSCRTRSNNGVETGYITTELGLHAPNTPLPIR